MSNQVTQTHRTKYRENVSMLLQQKEPKLLKCCIDEDVSGEMYKVTDQIGHVAPQKIQTRHGDVKYVNTPHDGRWLAAPEPIYYADLVDKYDKLLSGIELEGKYAMTGAATLNRGTDDAIIGGVFGTAQTGAKGTVLTAFDTNNVVPVNQGAGSNTNLSIKKLAVANEILRANFVDVDEDELWMAITASQNRALLGELEATSKDYAATGSEIRDGKINRLFGFNFAHIELGNPLLQNSSLTVDGSGFRKVPFWAKSGIFVGFWERDFASIDQLPQKHFSSQVYARRQVAATRTEEGKVGYILCNEAV